MQLNKVLKGLMIALPVLAMSACSSTSGTTSDSGKATDNAATTSESTAANQTNGTDTTVVSPIDGQQGQLSEQELKEQSLREKKTVFFAFDNSVVSNDYKDMLEAHAAYLVKHPDVKVTIEGNTDDRGTPEYNIALGARRAEAVSKYLQALGVPSSQISIVSYGEEKPIALGQNPKAWAKNRRAVIVY